MSKKETATAGLIHLLNSIKHLVVKYLGTELTSPNLLEIYVTLTLLPPPLRSIIISQHLLIFKWAFSCIWISTASQVGKRLLFQLVSPAACLCHHACGLLIHTAGPIFSPTLYPEPWTRREGAWLGWVTSKTHLPRSHTVLDHQSWWHQKHKFRTRFWSSEVLSP